MRKHKFIFYLIRWQLSGIVLAPCIYFIQGNAIAAAIIGNLIGGLIFYQVDKLIFHRNKFKDKLGLKCVNCELFRTENCCYTYKTKKKNPPNCVGYIEKKVKL